MTLVSLTFDDGLDCHLDFAMPALDRHGLKGTFYLPLGSEEFARRHADWRMAAQAGHELGNHSIFHPGVSTKSWVTEGIRIESYSLDRMSRELKAANTFLEALDGRKERTYAFPCSNPWIGGHGWPRRALAWAGLDRTRLAGWVDRFGLDFGATRIDYTQEVAPLFVAARCGGIAADALPAVPPDRHRVRGVEGDGNSLAQLEAAVATAKTRGAWLVLVFHGIGGGHSLRCELGVFEELLARLKSDPGVEVVTFLEGAKRLWKL
jgi:peptidoglycan/xylan/chitin deacetylase (PgdA/CDA1 family)